MDLELTNVINVSVSAAQAGVGAYNTSNLALFTREPAGGGFGDLGYKIYLEPSEVANDFGTDSATFKAAIQVFSQKPNILAGGGYLVIIPFLAGVDQQQTIALSAVAASGQFVLKFGDAATTPILWNDSAAVIQGKLRALPSLGAVTVTGSIAGESLVVDLVGVGGDPAVLTVTGDTLETGGAAAVTVTPSITTHGTNEGIDAAVVRTKDLVQYFGAMSAEITPATIALAAAAIVNALNKVGFWPARAAADVAPGGFIDLLRTGTLKQNRGLFYGSSDDLSAILFAASYAGRALSTDFSGDNTTQTMHLKDLLDQQPDPSMTQTLLAQCQAAGADVYASLQGVPKVFTSGANGFFDDVYNQQWFVGALAVAGFNALAESDTKLAQTEDGVDVLKGVYRAVCEQAITNQYGARGTWNSPSTFGNLKDFLRNISERGYYIFSQPVAQQLAVDRAARKAPLIQIALKEAGAVHSSSVIVNINA